MSEPSEADAILRLGEPDAVLRLDGLSVVLGGREVLRVEELSVRRGEVVAILGPNGAGKSTLLLSAALLREPARGAVTLFGERPGGRRQRVRLRRRTASVFGDVTLLDMSARANVETALRIHGVGVRERRRRAEGWLDRLGVLALAEARPHTLSAGEAQRVSLARAFAVEPELLLLDEPFASLDADTRARLVGDLRELLPAQRTTALLATHDRSEALLLAARALVLIDGRVAQEGTVAEVLARPRTVAVATFLGYSVLDEPAAQAALGVGARNASDGVVCLPPDAVRLASADTPGARAATVLAVRGGGGRAELVVDLGAPIALELPLAELSAEELRVGAEVWVLVDGARLVPLEPSCDTVGGDRC